MIQKIEDTEFTPGSDSPGPDFGMPVFRLGFRPFFLVAGIFAVLSMMVWAASYVFSVEFYFSGLAPNLWHAHEMVFGYAVAVIAGFLLTAIKNWTGIEVLRGKALVALLALWLVARIVPLSGLAFSIQLIAVVDVLFLFILTLVCLRPVIMARQYKQMGIISKLFLLMLCNVLFYSGMSGMLENGVQWGLYTAVYMIIALVLVMMRRVMPMFIRNGVDGEVEIKNRAWLDYSSLVLFLLLWIFDVFTELYLLSSFIAAVLTILHVIRLSGWYSHKIWSKPLVWVLVVAYGWIILGFALKALALTAVVSPVAWVHAFTVGGIGMVTIGMMSRVSLGHTGRDVFDPPPGAFWIMSVLFSGAIVRVIFPIFNAELYIYWIGLSQALWIIAFSLFIFIYAPMLVTPRIDGRDG